MFSPGVFGLFEFGHSNGWNAERVLFPSASGLGTVDDGNRSVCVLVTCVGVTGTPASGLAVQINAIT